MTRPAGPPSPHPHPPTEAHTCGRSPPPSPSGPSRCLSPLRAQIDSAKVTELVFQMLVEDPTFSKREIRCVAAAVGWGEPLWRFPP